MTTAVTIDAHAGWDVEVVLLENGVSGNFVYGYSNLRREIVPGGTSKTYHLHNNLEIKVLKEIPKVS